MDLTYWYLFPLGIIISAIVMSAGISGANFWIPVYLFILKLDPLISFWLALLTMVFGFGSGVTRNLHQRTVNWYLVKKYLIPTIPGAIIGSLLTAHLDANLLVIIFGIFVFIYGVFLLYNTIRSKQECQQHNTIYWKFGFMAGFLKGLIATGLGKIIVPCIWDHERIKNPAEVIGSTVLIIFIVDIVAALTRMNPVFVDALLNNSEQLIDIMTFVVPSVLIGGQLGPMAIKNVNKKALRIYISLMLILVSFFILGNVGSGGI
ncbi:sulfite exporter TauE/SafE family protein [Methanolobus sp. ZRKC3]|uniref:sulfite exporter TauE/SafE family protein n=1 Tax=Methanolobus sp. ZRKC3 TaxID=3125786 RepID=UPI00324CB65E